jgi:type 1 glutamine amidotransferase
MKAIIPSILTVVAALFAVALKRNTEEVPPGAAEKMADAIPAKAYAEPQKPRKLLVFSKTNGFRHASIPTGKLLLEKLGSQTGAFEVVISDDLENFEKEKLNTFDAVCFLNTTMNVFAPHPKEFKNLPDAEKAEITERENRLQANLMEFIKKGRGFVGIHAATDSCYDWPEYGKMINGWFNGHPWLAVMPVSVKVEPGQEKHPLVSMFEGQNVEFKEEIYQFKDPYDSKAVRMLLRLDTEKTNMMVPGIKRKDQDFGVSWARNWDQGRVFYSSLGHNHEIYWHPKVVRHFLAGIQWALGDLKADVD